MEFKLDDFLTEKEKRFREQVLINQGNISGQMALQPRKVYEMAMIVNECEDELDKAKFELLQIQYSLNKSLRKQANQKEDKLTEKQIEEKVKTHSRYIEAYERFLEAKKVLNKAKARQLAIKERSEMLINIGYMRRKEIDSVGKDKIKVTKE